MKYFTLSLFFADNITPLMLSFLSDSQESALQVLRDVFNAHPQKAQVNRISVDESAGSWYYTEVVNPEEFQNEDVDGYDCAFVLEEGKPSGYGSIHASSHEAAEDAAAEIAKIIGATFTVEPGSHLKMLMELSKMKKKNRHRADSLDKRKYYSKGFDFSIEPLNSK